MDIDRRGALKSLAAKAGATGMTVTPVTTKDAEGVALIVLKADCPIKQATADRLKAHWEAELKGTPLEGVRTMVLGDGLSAEFLRR